MLTVETVGATAAILLLATLLVLEGRRFGGARRVLRRLALLLLVAGLWVLVVRPTWTRPVHVDQAVLITPGATADGVRAARHAAGADAPVLAVDMVDTVARGASALPDIGALRRLYPGLAAVQVAGHGLPAWEWERLPTLVRRAGSAETVEGMSHVHWPREIVLGQSWTVRGRVAGDRGAGGELRLIGPGGTVAREEIPDRKPTAFRLLTTPPRPGRQLYRLALVAADGVTIDDETLDLVVRAPEPLAILWLEGAPGFETRHFKSWLTRRGDSLVLRTTISRDRQRIERLNHPRVGVDRLTEELLRRFDLLVLDARSVSALVPGERTALARSVEAGLGVLLLDARSDDLARARPAFLGQWPTREMEGLERFAARPRFPEGRVARPLDIEPREWVTGERAFPLLADDSGAVLAVWRMVGSGAVGATLLEDTFRWALAGDAEDHGRYWSHVIGRLARRRPDPRWRVADGPILIDDPLTLTLATSEPRPPCSVLHGAEAIALAPRQDPLEPGVFRTTFRPRHEGWHTVRTPAGSTEFYAQPRAAWEAWQWTRRAAATGRRSVLSPQRRTESGGAALVSVGIPPLPAFLVVLACLAALWIDERR